MKDIKQKINKEEIEQYLKFKDQEGILKKYIKELRDKFMVVLERNNDEMQIDKFKLSIEKRENFEYDSDIIGKILNSSQWQIVTDVIVSKKKIGGLIKGGFITEQEIKPAKKIIKITKALIVEKNKTKPD